MSAKNFASFWDFTHILSWYVFNFPKLKFRKIFNSVKKKRKKITKAVFFLNKTVHVARFSSFIVLVLSIFIILKKIRVVYFFSGSKLLYYNIALINNKKFEIKKQHKHFRFSIQKLAMFSVYD